MQPTRLPIPGILQARTLEWVAISFSMEVKSESEVAQSHPTPSDPMDCSLPGSSVHGIFQARVLEWGAIVFSVASIRWTFISKVMSLLFNTLSRLVMEKAMAPHSSTFAWKIPWAEEPGRLQSMGSLRV